VALHGVVGHPGAGSERMPSEDTQEPSERVCLSKGCF